MRLVASDGSSFALAVIGYQFPEMKTELYDSNWLRIQININHPRGNWTATDAMLLTYEVAQLADWLDDLACGRLSLSECGFIEPNLEFRVLATESGEPKLRVLFELEARPSWAETDGAGMEDLWLEFPLNELELHRASRSLREHLEKFPQRADH
jgi:hypothetical protein